MHPSIGGLGLGVGGVGDSAGHGDIINTEQLLLAIDCGILHGMFYPHQNVVDTNHLHIIMVVIILNLSLVRAKLDHTKQSKASPYNIC